MVFALSHGARVEFGGYHSMVVGVYSVICFSMPEVGFLQTSFRVNFSIEHFARQTSNHVKPRCNQQNRARLARALDRSLIANSIASPHSTEGGHCFHRRIHRNIHVPIARIRRDSNRTQLSRHPRSDSKHLPSQARCQQASLHRVCIWRVVGDQCRNLRGSFWRKIQPCCRFSTVTVIMAQRPCVTKTNQNVLR